MNKENFIQQDFLLQLWQLDYLDVLALLSFNSLFIGAYNLHKEYKPKNIKKVVLPPELKFEYTQFDRNKITNTEFGEFLINFANIMIKKFPQKNLTNFYNNINTLTTSYSKFKLFNLISRGYIVGTYNPRKNKITTRENNISQAIYHELLHMASSTYKEKIVYSGFSQMSLKPGFANLGKGINEGYTELLNRRYFIEEGGLIPSYEYELIITRKLEKIIGKQKMQELYLNANLHGLIQELKQYSNDEEIMKFISNTDFILFHLDHKILKMGEKKLLINSLKNVNKFLLKAYSTKLRERYLQKNITYEKLITKLAKYVSSLPSNIKTETRTYEALSNDELKECLDSVFGKSTISLTSEAGKIYISYKK